jgi:predicted RNA-binding protein YlqC (UPF0109 family)
VLNLIEFLVEALVDAPEQVNIPDMPQEEVGKANGKRGRIANALRTVGKAVVMRNKR